MTKLFTFDKTINAGEKFYLKDIISDVDYKEWFSTSDNPKIFILNKGRCGNCGTSGFINYAKKHTKGIYIMVPNVSIARSKEFDNEIFVYMPGRQELMRTNLLKSQLGTQA